MSSCTLVQKHSEGKPSTILSKHVTIKRVGWGIHGHWLHSASFVVAIYRKCQASKGL